VLIKKIINKNQVNKQANAIYKNILIFHGHPLQNRCRQGKTVAQPALVRDFSRPRRIALP
jgi:hypothetical protein